MTRIDKLRAEANRRSETFEQSASATLKRFRPSRLVDNIVGELDPGFVQLDRITTEAKRNPFAVLILGGVLWLVVRQMTSRILMPGALTRQGKRPIRLSREIRKGEENDNVNDAKHF